MELPSDLKSPTNTDAPSYNPSNLSDERQEIESAADQIREERKKIEREKKRQLQQEISEARQQVQTAEDIMSRGRNLLQKKILQNPPNDKVKQIRDRVQSAVNDAKAARDKAQQFINQNTN